MKDWLSGWYHTLYIRFREPKLYRFLAEMDFSEEDFTAVQRPE